MKADRLYVFELYDGNEYSVLAGTYKDAIQKALDMEQFMRSFGIPEHRGRRPKEKATISGSNANSGTSNYNN